MFGKTFVICCAALAFAMSAHADSCLPSIILTKDISKLTVIENFTEAERLRKLIADGKLHVFSEEVLANPEIAKVVGDRLKKCLEQEKSIAK